MFTPPTNPFLVLCSTLHCSTTCLLSCHSCLCHSNILFLSISLYSLCVCLFVSLSVTLSSTISICLPLYLSPSISVTLYLGHLLSRSPAILVIFSIPLYLCYILYLSFSIPLDLCHLLYLCLSQLTLWFILIFYICQPFTSCINQ